MHISSKMITRLALALFLCVAAAIMVGIMWHGKKPADQQMTMAIALAQAEAKRHGLTNTHVGAAVLRNHVWEIELEIRVAPFRTVEGGHATVRIAEDGKILSYVPGL